MFRFYRVSGLGLELGLRDYGVFFLLRKPKPQPLPRTVNREGDKVLRLQAAHWGVSQSKPDVAFHGVGGA